MVNMSGGEALVKSLVAEGVEVVVGDGGFMFNSSELSTAVRYGIGVVTVVFRNDSYGNVARDLNEFFDGTYETDLPWTLPQEGLIAS